MLEVVAEVVAGVVVFGDIVMFENVTATIVV